MLRAASLSSHLSLSRWVRPVVRAGRPMHGSRLSRVGRYRTVHTGKGRGRTFRAFGALGSAGSKPRGWLPAADRPLKALYGQARLCKRPVSASLKSGTEPEAGKQRRRVVYASSEAD